MGDVQENLTRIELDNHTSAGIYWRSLGAGMVPIFEEHLARLERNIRLDDWRRMEAMERAMVIAIRRVENAAKNHQAEAEAKAAKRNAKKGKH